MGRVNTGALTPKELEHLVAECREIASDWDTYAQFCKNRDAVLSQYMPKDGLN